MKKNLTDYSMNLFDFGNDDNGEYINIREKQDLENGFIVFDISDLVNENDSSDFRLVANWFCRYGALIPYGTKPEEVRKEIQEIVDTKCYHFANMGKGLYAYSYKIKYDNGEVNYRFMLENENYIIATDYTIQDIDKVLSGEELICYPACCLEIFDTKGNCVNGGWGDYDKDIRYKIVCDQWKTLEFGKNRIEPKKKPKDFCEVEFGLPDLVKFWGSNDTIKERENE